MSAGRWEVAARPGLPAGVAWSARLARPSVVLLDQAAMERERGRPVTAGALVLAERRKESLFDPRVVLAGVHALERTRVGEVA